MPDYDTHGTVAYATEHKLGAVQPFVNEQLRDPEYRARLIEGLKADKNLDVVLHLPNMDKLIQDDLDAASEIVTALLPRRVRTLVHYEQVMSVEQVPVVAGKKVGIENSLTGKYPHSEHLNHVLRAFRLSREAKSFFVFDPGRLMYEDGETPVEEIQEFITRVISRLDPARDVIHMADKAAWNIRFRQGPRAFPKGIGRFMVSSLQDFYLMGGTIIFEHEDADMALESILFFES